MRNAYLRNFVTPSVERAQEEAYGRSGRPRASVGEVAGFGASELEFIAERDSFCLASVSESGWPYIQHRGGAKGFLKAIGDRALAFVDLEGNRQLISVGNLAVDDRVSLFLMDYRARERLKVMGRARVAKPEDEPDIAAALGIEAGSTTHRLFVIEVVGYDWNCPKFITQRFTRDEVEQATRPLRARIEELETALAKR